MEEGGYPTRIHRCIHNPSVQTETKSLRSSDARWFADDSLLYRTVIGVKENNRMSFNPSKCSVICVTEGRRKKIYNPSYRLHDQELEVVDSSKYLGVKVTSNLTWSSHIADVAGKANRSLGFLRRNFTVH